MDQYLLEKGLAGSRTKAQALILAGQVKVDGQIVLKVGTLIPRIKTVELVAPEKYVSRGGHKLEGALEDFKVIAQDRVCLDVGASTGGFTDCLLQSGAKFVHAIDVGRAQLADSLKNHPKVRSVEEKHILDVHPEDLDPKPNLAVIDVSFISIKKVIEQTAKLLEKPAEIIAMVKPQFEVGAKKLKKGVVRSEEDQKMAVDEISQLATGLGLEVLGVSPARLKGPKGNQEYFLHLKVS